MLEVVVAFKAHLGWVNAVAVAQRTNELTVVRAGRINIAPAGNREALEPYHVAAGFDGLERVTPPADPRAFVERALKQQRITTLAALRSYARELLAQDISWQLAVMLTGRGIAMDLDHILESHAHVHVGEGEAVRNSTRAALSSMKIACVDQDEKDTLPTAAEVLGVDPAKLDTELKNTRPDGVRNWRKEERLLALAAWLRR